MFAFFLMGAAFIAIGIFISSLTENQGFATRIGIAVILFNYFSVSLAEYVSATAFGSAAVLFVFAVLITSVSYDDLRHEEIFWADFDLVNQIDVVLENNTYTFTTVEEEEQQMWYYGETQIDTDTLQTALESLSASSFTNNAADQKEEICLTLHLENENTPQVTLQFYRYDAGYCLAVVDGESTALIQRASVVSLIEAVLAVVLN